MTAMGFVSPRRVRDLSGKFLRMYLDQVRDEDTLKLAAEEIGASPEFEKLTADTQAYVQAQVTRRKHLPTALMIEDDARVYLQRLQKSKGIAFEGGLHAVIHGVAGVDVTRGKIQATLGAAGASDTLGYQIEVVFKDTYDFANKRGGSYDAFRKQLAKLLKEHKYQEFLRRYDAEVRHSTAAHAVYAYNLFKEKVLRQKHQPTPNGIDLASVFASYVYALEMNGFTQGLPWEAAVPMSGSVHHP